MNACAKAKLMYLRPSDVFYDPGTSGTDHVHTSQTRLTTIAVQEVPGFAKDLIVQEMACASLTRLGFAIVPVIEVEGRRG